MIATAIAEQREPTSPPAGNQSGGAAGFALELRGPTDPPIVNGRTKPRLSPVAYAALRALIEAGSKGLSCADLDKVTGRENTRQALRRLARDEEWAPVLLMPGPVDRLGVSRGYRVAGPARYVAPLVGRFDVPGLSDAERRTIEALVTGHGRYAHHPSFELDDAEPTILKAADAIPEAATAWLLGAPGQPRQDSWHTMNDHARALLLAFNFCRYRIAGIVGRLGGGWVTARDAAELLAWHDRAIGLRNRAVAELLPIAFSAARKGWLGPVKDGDVSAAGWRLMQFVDRCPLHIDSFTGAAWRSLWFAVRRCRRNEWRRMERWVELAQEPAARGELPDLQQPLAIVGWIMRTNAANLSDLERRVVQERLEGTPTTRRFTEPGEAAIGARLGITRHRVQTLYASAIDKLRKAFERATG